MTRILIHLRFLFCNQPRWTFVSLSLFLFLVFFHLKFFDPLSFVSSVFFFSFLSSQPSLQPVFSHLFLSPLSSTKTKKQDHQLIRKIERDDHELEEADLRFKMLGNDGCQRIAKVSSLSFLSLFSLFSLSFLSFLSFSFYLKVVNLSFGLIIPRCLSFSHFSLFSLFSLPKWFNLPIFFLFSFLSLSFFHHPSFFFSFFFLFLLLKDLICLELV